jgi:hypothetical protein
MGAEVDPDLPHRADRQWVNTRGLGPRARRFEVITGEVAEQALGHLAPRRIVRAQEQYAAPHHHASLPPARPAIAMQVCMLERALFSTPRP